MSWARYIVDTAVAMPGQDVAYPLLTRQTSRAHITQFTDAVMLASVQAQQARLALQTEVESLAL